MKENNIRPEIEETMNMLSDNGINLLGRLVRIAAENPHGGGYNFEKAAADEVSNAWDALSQVDQRVFGEFNLARQMRFRVNDFSGYNVLLDQEEELAGLPTEYVLDIVTLALSKSGIETDLFSNLLQNIPKTNYVIETPNGSYEVYELATGGKKEYIFLRPGEDVPEGAKACIEYPEIYNLSSFIDTRSDPPVMRRLNI